jgi:6-phosphogluconolactonase
VTRTLTVLPTVDAVAMATADRILAAGRNAIRRRGRFAIALSGGSTPLAICPILVVPPRVTMLDWSKVEFFFGDERAVPPDSAESNFMTAKLALLDYLRGVRPERVHRMPADAPDLAAAAAAYQDELRATLGERPRFDVVWLGMGADGHTASLFPGSEALTERRRLVVANYAPGPAAWRMTLTYPVLNAAREALFVVTGGEKADALASVWTDGDELPAARVRARRTTWLVDAAAAAKLPAVLSRSG